MTFEEVDACTGPALGWPKSATFRLADLVGIDVLLHVVRNIYDNIPGRRIARTLPRAALDRGTGAPRMAGRQDGPRLLPAREKIRRRIRNPHARSRENGVPPAAEGAVCFHRSRQGHRGYARAAAHAGWPCARREKKATRRRNLFGACISEMCLYAARRVPEISDSIVDVDRAMRWGFGWELGPFETWDAVGVEAHGEAARKRGQVAAAAGHGAAFFGEEIVLSVRAGRDVVFRSRGQ